MISKELKSKYRVVVGLEVHAQLQTESKIFASDPNQFGVDANTNIGVITLAHIILGWCVGIVFSLSFNNSSYNFSPGRKPEYSI